MTDPWRPLWRAGEGRHRPVLEAAGETEIAIVGAGLEGLSLAVELARRGRRVAVVEAGEIGQGATGASAGIVSPQLVRQSPDDVARRFGPRQGLLYLTALAEAGRRTFERIGRRVEQAQAHNGGFIAPTKGAAGLARIRSTVDQWRPIRKDLRTLSAEETRALTGTVGYSGALLDPSGGALNPVAYAELLAADAEDAGALIFLRSPVIALDRAGAEWRLRTAKSVLRARQVILCANGGNPGLASRLRHSILPLSVCQMATQPLGPQMRRAILPQGHSMTDVETDVFSIRFDTDGRLITAYPMSERLRDPVKLTELVNRRLSSVLPAFQPTPLDYAWTGTAWLNSDLLPRVVTLGDDMFAIQACNGRGIALSTALGIAFGEWLADGASGDCAIPIQQPRGVRGYVLARYLPGLLMKMSLTGKRLRRAFHAGRRRDAD